MTHALNEKCYTHFLMCLVTFLDKSRGKIILCIQVKRNINIVYSTFGCVSRERVKERDKRERK